MPETYTPKEMLAKLVGFNTTSHLSNMALIDFVTDYLAGHGIESTLVPDLNQDKANLYATIGPAIEGGVVLSGHTDVVPVEGQDWISNPFELTEREGKLFGRGTCDMKAFFAISLAYVPQMLAADLKRPIHLALSYDEETGCTGAPHLIAHMADHLPKPMAVIVGEPTSMKVVSAHKASLGLHTHVRGHSVHSSQVHLGVSAVTFAARLVAWLDDRMQDGAKRSSPENPYNPPYTSIHTGTINGGTAGNIVAKDCEFVTDIRAIDEDDPHQIVNAYKAYIRETIEPPMKSVAPETGVTVTMTSDVPGLHAETDGAAEQLARHLTGDNSVNFVAYATEAGQFQQADHSVAICGPGSIDQAHKADEFLTLNQLTKGTEFQKRLIDYLSS